MFKSQNTKNHERALALVGMVNTIAKTSFGSKGRGAERMEAMAQVVAALGFDPSSIKSVEIDWKVIEGEYCPVLRMESSTGETKEITQTDR